MNKKKVKKMGLDMSLRRVWYLHSIDEEKVKKKFAEILSINGVTGAKIGRVSTITEEKIYWRKVNSIHNWFVQNVQEGEDDCGDYEVSLEKLESLRDIVKKVLEDHSSASSLLPTTDGFFFGSTEYDEDYFEELQYTKEELDKLFEEEEKLNDGDTWYSYNYTSSW